MLLIEEAFEAKNLEELISDWLWTGSYDHQSALELRTWFQLNYQELGSIYELNPREIAQILRNLRAQRLQSPELIENEAALDATGLSCFMVEQHLSSWIDEEVSDLRSLQNMEQHLAYCEKCHQRLSAYRELHSTILQQRKHFEPVTPEEWEETIEAYFTRRRRFVLRSLLYIGALLAIVGVLSWAIWFQQERMPNVYEINEPSK